MSVLHSEFNIDMKEYSEQEFPIMGSRPIDPKELLKGLDCFLGKDGEVRTHEGITKIFNLMKDAQKMVSRCIYLNILLQTRAQDILSKFIKVGGYKLLNTWLTGSKASNNVPLLQQILLTLQHLPLTVDHLKQNNTAKLVKQLSKSSEDEELRRLASVLVSDWMGVIRSQSSSQPAERDKKKRKEENKNKTPIQEKPQEAKSEAKLEETPEKKKEKPKSLRTTAPSHAKFRSTGLEMETPSLIPVKKNTSAAVTSDKYNLKPIPLKRQNTSAPTGENPPAEKKYKPLNTTPNTTKEIKVKIIPPQPMEGLGFLDALNSAPVPGIKIKKKKKVLSPTAAKPSPFEGKPVAETSAAKPSSPELTPASEPMDVDRPGTPVPAVEGGLLDPKIAESPVDTQLTKKGKKKKTVSWPEESKLREYFYFELDETERVNVNKIKDFGEAAKREMLKDRHAFETARRLSYDAMEEKIPWVYPKTIDLPAPLVQPGSGSQEKFTQAEREKGILQELFLSKESVPDSPHEPDPESYEPVPPKLIPLDEECSMDEATYEERLDPATASQSPDGAGGSKLPPVLANLMGSMGTGKNPQGPNPNSSINVQEILTSIMFHMGCLDQDPVQSPMVSHQVLKICSISLLGDQDPCLVGALAQDPALSIEDVVAEGENLLSVDEVAVDGVEAPTMVGVALPTTAWAVAMEGDTAAEAAMEGDMAVVAATEVTEEGATQGTTAGDIQAVIQGTTAGDIQAVIQGTTAGDIQGTTAGDIQGTTAEVTQGTTAGGTEAATVEVNIGNPNCFAPRVEIYRDGGVRLV
ncbi:hypothetical protein JD844_013406 [Phrynosoma platyrhinos]|uniref:TFIIS N-terminal domain-containing protein n=1 Tax=Phrynosoma platyrhinos TaxID=52577 RepID=A0ABQ7TKR9_PHRPL|nr:hypothetical protein JD844_013406 [Phrynosoma platyrhinos]